MNSDEVPNLVAHIRAPWTDEQLARLEARQRAAWMHPYTCVEHSRLPLIPTKSGWICPHPGCLCYQDWCLAVDANEPLMEPPKGFIP